MPSIDGTPTFWNRRWGGRPGPGARKAGPGSASVSSPPAGASLTSRSSVNRTVRAKSRISMRETLPQESPGARSVAQDGREHEGPWRGEGGSLAEVWIVRLVVRRAAEDQAVVDGQGHLLVEDVGDAPFELQA